jgi:hypothetical protein
MLNQVKLYSSKIDQYSSEMDELEVLAQTKGAAGVRAFLQG